MSNILPIAKNPIDPNVIQATAAIAPPLNNTPLKIPIAPSMKKFEMGDIFQCKIGISIITFVVTYGLLTILNPPFVNCSGEKEDRIEIQKPNLTRITYIALIVSVILLLIPATTRQEV
jgi:hypothetical protein